MKKLILSSLLLISLSGFCQKAKIYATVFDSDNNPVARGAFKSAADSGVIILVDGMEIFVTAAEITVLKIEKNPSSNEFLKLGASTATEVVHYLINKPKSEPQANVSDSTAPTENIISTETKDVLFEKLGKLLQDLLNGKNDLAMVNINNSPEKFASKLRLLQEYSIDKEIVAWADYRDQAIQGGNNETGVVQEGNDETGAVQEGTVSTDMSESSDPAIIQEPNLQPAASDHRVVLIKGFTMIKPRKPQTMTPGVIRTTTIKKPTHNATGDVNPGNPPATKPTMHNATGASLGSPHAPKEKKPAPMNKNQPVNFNIKIPVIGTIKKN